MRNLEDTKRLPFFNGGYHKFSTWRIACDCFQLAKSLWQRPERGAHVVKLLNCEEFANLKEARWFAKRREQEHNEERPHSSLADQTPSEFAACCATSVRATPSLRKHTAESLTQPELS